MKAVFFQVVLASTALSAAQTVFDGLEPGKTLQCGALMSILTLKSRLRV